MLASQVYEHLNQASSSGAERVGAAMAKHCTNCGHELREGDKFCSECGIVLGVSDIGSANERMPGGDATLAGRTKCPNLACPQPDDVQKVSVVI
jgi:hypothetical protein